MRLLLELLDLRLAQIEEKLGLDTVRVTRRLLRELELEIQRVPELTPLIRLEPDSQEGE